MIQVLPGLLACMLVLTASLARGGDQKNDSAENTIFFNEVQGVHFTDDSAPRVLVEVEFGLDHVSEAGNKRYFWVTAAMNIGVAPGSERIPFYDVEVVPYSTGGASPMDDDDRTFSSRFRYLPIEVMKDSELKLGTALSIRAVGWGFDSEIPIAQSQVFARFAKVAADVVGLRYMNMTGASNYLGFEVVKVHVEQGVAWKPTAAQALRFSLGGTAAFSYGGNLDTKDVDLGMLVDVYSRLTYALGTRRQLQIFAQGGFKNIRLPDMSDGDKNALHFYMQAGFGGNF